MYAMYYPYDFTQALGEHIREFLQYLSHLLDLPHRKGFIFFLSFCVKTLSLPHISPFGFHTELGYVLPEFPYLKKINVE